MVRVASSTGSHQEGPQGGVGRLVCVRCGCWKFSSGGDAGASWLEVFLKTNGSDDPHIVSIRAQGLDCIVKLS